MPSAPNPPAGAPEAPKKHSWDQIRSRANTIGSIAALFLFLLLVGGLGGYFWSLSRKTPPATGPTVQTLSPEDLQKLSEIGANLGTTGQVLNIGANALFRGKIDVGGDLSIGGRLNANGPVTLSQLNITGTTAATGLNVGSNLIVSGTTTLQRSLIVQALATIEGGLNVSGSASLNAVNANSIAVRNISISGPLTIGHLSTQGPTPSASTGAVGGGGTVSISGNDTAGTININTGSGPSVNTTLMTITFRAAYTATPRVLLMPRTAGAATAHAYVIPSSTNFRILAVNPPAGSTLTFDYFVTQ